MKQKLINEEIARIAAGAEEISKYLWDNPETGGNEKASADYMAAKLQEQGFTMPSQRTTISVWIRWHLSWWSVPR